MRLRSTTTLLPTRGRARRRCRARGSQASTKYGAPHQARPGLLLVADDRQPTTVHIAGAGEIMAARIFSALATLAAGGMRLPVTIGLSDDLLIARGTLVSTSSSPPVPPIGLRRDPAHRRGVPARRFPNARPHDRRRGDGGRLGCRAVPFALVGYADLLPIVRRYWRSEFGWRSPNPVAVVIPDLPAAVIAGSGVSVLPGTSPKQRSPPSRSSSFGCSTNDVAP